jgi:hypothetical protein
VLEETDITMHDSDVLPLVKPAGGHAQLEYFPRDRIGFETCQKTQIEKSPTVGKKKKSKQDAERKVHIGGSVHFVSALAAVSQGPVQLGSTTHCSPAAGSSPQQPSCGVPVMYVAAWNRSSLRTEGTQREFNTD